MNDKKVVITKYEEKICSFLLQNNRLLAINSLTNESRVGSVYVGKVKNVLHNIQACFVEISEKEICFLPFAEVENAFCLNRTLQGLPVQGDDLLVQITKEVSKNKLASVTCNITYTGNYFVFTVGKRALGVSSKLSKEQKEHIKNLFIKNKYVDERGQFIANSPQIPEYGCIVRTQTAESLEDSEDAFGNVFKQEHQEFVNVFQKALHAKCFQCIHNPVLTYESLLSSYGINEYDEIVTDLNEAFTALQGHSKSVRLYEDTNYSLSKLYSLETKVKEALSKYVWLKSGANLIVESTECLTTIDVNSAKSIKKGLSQDTILQINREAAEEIAIQLRLRNLSGIIIIDFINMENPDNEASLLAYMKNLVTDDTITTKVIDITPLGLMELTRKKVHKPLSEQLRG